MWFCGCGQQLKSIKNDAAIVGNRKLTVPA